jgi:hypothetical protein
MTIAEKRLAANLNESLARIICAITATDLGCVQNIDF